MAKKTLQLIVEPDDGVEPVLALINSAKKSLRVLQFTLDEPHCIDAVLAAHKRGVDVQVMLNPHKSGGERGNDATHATLTAHKVPVEWSNPRFAVTHQKTIVVDDQTALIATFNLSAKYFGETRDHGLVTDDAAIVKTIVAGFEADWHRKPFTPPAASPLLWSPDNSRRRMAEFIDGAKHRIDVQHPKFVDTTIIERLAAARARGVHVRLLCGGKHGLSPWDFIDTFASLRILERAGVKLKRQKHLKLHAKLLLADEKRALVGSMNIDRSAFDVRRELGLVLDDGHVVERLGQLFEHDWKKAGDYVPPDPLTPETHDIGELPHDPNFHHE
ncbi:MAG TPA: phospholipase D-like domain-containing protein [Candidatus Binatia bacterium]|jgi:phosphatidylserine/phosphatidylglycerophosphate/cardiolipin synthase-like enzyme|nr:phospholipase D-like domain-containing protein [Candidatus Binatia bacterium]